MLSLTDDPYGFAHWVDEHATALAEFLGVGIHSGEWWGKKIQRAYDMKERRFSLFNVERWDRADAQALGIGLDVVPVLYQGPWTGLLGYKVNDEARPDHGQWMNLAEQTDWSDVDFAREIETRIEEIMKVGVTTPDPFTHNLVRDMLHNLAPTNPRPRYAPNFILEHLRRTGSQAAPGYMRPEGIVVYHKASDTLFKAYVDPRKDAKHKGEE
jgi:hypothetical protein